jgi:diguanylate cyclase (GGDEF)-like protein
MNSNSEIELLRRRVVELEARISELELLAATDELTGLLNRRAFKSRLNDEVLACSRYSRTIALLMIDLDRLKSINDRCGHTEGDRALRLVAETIRAALRQTDVIGRLGGDEFGVILQDPGLTGASQAAERIRAEIADHSCGDIHISVSIGAADYFHQNSSSAALLMEGADKQLYRAKAQGGNCVCTAETKLETT